jgi:uncharacterized protein YegP (UPF0339 family)
MAPNARIEVYRDNAGEWRWRKLAANNAILADSGEGYENQTDAVDAASKESQGEPVLLVEEE